MRESLTIQLYEILENHKNTYGYHYLYNQIPNNFNCGIYFFFDNTTHIKEELFKITYIGITKNNLNNRLEKHQINGPSSFRDHVQAAIENNHLNQINLTTNEYIHSLPYIFIEIINEIQLKEVEKKLIKLTSNFEKTHPLNIANDNWLGYNSPNVKIRSGHTWNIQNIKGEIENSEILEYQKILEVLSQNSKQM